jgi:o-succinylbenzoate synthase
MQLSIRRCSSGSLGAHNARRAWASRSGLLLELQAGSLRGLGEAAPLPGYSTDTLEGAETALRALDTHALERALDIEQTKEALKCVADLLPQTQPAARMALETAALDLRGQQSRLSAPAILGADSSAVRPLAWLAGAPDAQALETIRGAQRAGYRHFKLKLGRVGQFDAEIAGVRALRRALGAGPRLRLDANHGWSEAQAGSAATLLQELDIEFVEEPSSKLTRHRGASIPVALDESLRGLDPGDLETLAVRTGARFVVLKPMVLGGLSHCIELARHAAALNLGVVVSHSFDGPVALIASAALALALPTRIAQGLAPHAGLAAWPPVPLPIANATLQTWKAPGLGLAGGLFN